MSDPEDRAFAIDLWVDSQADLLRPTGCEDPDAVARALWLSDLQVVPLADPAPVGLTEALRPWLRHRSTACARNNHADPCSCGLDDALARLSAAPVDDRERVPEGWRVGTKTISDADGTVLWSFPTLIQNVEPPVLVPVSHSVNPEEKPDG